ncbi:Peptidase S9, prolyl oligopeptidase active site region [Planktothrix serta PCC 8927]|uniref:Peptidase S9, prolyl oligopeptidase active site region n=1 Tax=Planktothrix serta PCC 8927 TaxID=671068 RepID=A0A7Z9BQP0_9CYAN|nr:S9 family peptidase [Planktothrix serta]VXD20343.1 Peptidase S9, prolyl oligopeptidase active site region [Planktothrix serta PCC 8927]
MSKKTAQYGSWKSPLIADLIVEGTVGLGGLTGDGDNIYWIEGRPSEAGRSVIVRLTPDNQLNDVTPQPLNARTRVHEYGGGSYIVNQGNVYFSNFVDQRLYQQKIQGENTPHQITPAPITPEGAYRYADGVIDSQNQRLICVREDHTQGGEPVNTIVSINLNNSQEIRVLVEGHDFYAFPRLSPDNKKLSWISWNHPNMPWDGTELWIADVNSEGSLGEKILIAGGTEESIFQPQWSPDGVLYFVSDRSNWWNLYRYTGTIEPLHPIAAEFGLPLWVFGMSTYGFSSAEKIICTYSKNGNSYLASLDTKTLQLQDIDTSYTAIDSLKVSGNQVLFIGSSPTESSAIVKLNLDTGELEVLRRSSQIVLDKGYLSVPQPIEFPTENGKTAYGFFYPPQNKDYQASEAEKPPLVVKSHGGPTAATSSSLSLKNQYWTSRGFAVLDVNYGGSTGYGREYRQRLNKSWGIVDVDDCCNGAKYLAEQGLVDGNRMAIAGGSAGGYTTLCALTFKDVFKAGASYYGVSDLEALATDTHKFESRYLDGLIGAYPEEKAIYQQRSPIYSVDKLSCPVIFFQGSEDKIVPPNQAEMMVAALKAKGVTVEYVLFEGEQHGFRKAENIKSAIDGEFNFYAKVFGFEPAK